MPSRDVTIEFLAAIEIDPPVPDYFGRCYLKLQIVHKTAESSTLTD